MLAEEVYSEHVVVGPLRPPSGWAETPDLLLEDIYRLLSFPDRHSCSQVCWAWYLIFYYPGVWRRILVTPKSFTYHRFNLYQGYQRELSKHRVQMWLSRVGKHVRSITIQPNYNLHNIYGFIEVLERFLAFFDKYPMPMLEKFSYTFHCEDRDIWSHEMRVRGTGGTFLELLRRLLGRFRRLRALTLNHLFLDSQDVDNLFDDFASENAETLERLELLNCVKTPYPMYSIRSLCNLRELEISPAMVTDDMLIVIIQETRLRYVIFTQDPYSLPITVGIDPRNWWVIKQIAPYLEVALEVKGRTEQEVIVQPEAPVTRIFYSCFKSQVRPDVISNIVDEYRRTLRTYGHALVTRRHRSRAFTKRADRSLVTLVRECQHLETLVITERVSTATLLVLATEGKRLRNLIVRRNAVILRCDWKKDLEWKETFYRWLRATSQSYQETETEVAKLLGVTKWHMLSDQAFMDIVV